jgi:hypothetical protein
MKSFSVLSLLLALLLGACSSGSSPASSQATPPPGDAGLGAAGEGPDAGGPAISWDHPFQAEGKTVDAAAVVASPKSFGLSIAPLRPALSKGALRWVDVSSGGTVAFMYDFRGDPRFPTDGRVQVEEEPATMTQDALVQGTWAGTEHSVTNVGSIAVLLRSSGGLADATFIYKGVMFDVTGPAVSPAAALDVATELATEAQHSAP